MLALPLGAASAEPLISRLQAQQERGAFGLKIWKPFGLVVRDQHQALVKVDDERLDPLWQAAGELDMPVLILEEQAEKIKTKVKNLSRKNLKNDK